MHLYMQISILLIKNPIISWSIDATTARGVSKCSPGWILTLEMINSKRPDKIFKSRVGRTVNKLRSGNGKIIFIYCSNWQKSSFVTVYWYCYWILPPIKENSFAKSMELECTIRANKYQLCHFDTNRKKSMPTCVLLKLNEMIWLNQEMYCWFCSFRREIFNKSFILLTISDKYK